MKHLFLITIIATESRWNRSKQRCKHAKFNMDECWTDPIPIDDIRMGHKHRLEFILTCATAEVQSECAKAGCQSKCEHTESERAFSGTYATVELKKALELGYKIVQVYHGVEYKNWVENNADGEGGLFTSYINSMMAEKIVSCIQTFKNPFLFKFQYSSGWPSNVNTDEEKAEYCQGYWEKEHIRLDDWTRFVKNAGKRAVAKLLLNSLWGKFAQRVDREHTEIVIDPSKFWKLVNDTSIALLDVRPVNDVVVIKYRKKAETQV
ncbi:hypothetical protein CRE_15015 [Caenorhabditis remanei]|uniref:DNA-directed DNA polymerase n=1 Tax=Caenorhabditis remanei TaxID=31234 RepID=E3NIQ3_CAERE|nr:hypothetical protein CRE_15015 [Caenorhabditis remanei]